MLFKSLFILINLEYNYIIIYTDSNDFTYWKSRSKKSSKNQNFSSIRSPRGGYCFPLKLVRRKNKLLLKVSKSRRCEKTPSSPLCGTMQTRHWFFTSFNSLQRVWLGHIHRYTRRRRDPGWTTNTQSKILSLSLFLSLLIVYYPFHSIPLSRLARGERIVRSAQHRRPVHTPSAHILYI